MAALRSYRATGPGRAHLLVEDAEEVDGAGGPHAAVGARFGLVGEVALRGGGKGARQAWREVNIGRWGLSIS